MALVKMEIEPFKDDTFSTSAGASFFVQINPDAIKYKQEIETSSKGPIGGQFRSPKYVRHKPVSFSFDIVLDGTGVLGLATVDVPNAVSSLEETVYDYNGDIHRPNYLKISWGTFLFKGVLNSMDYDYTLFNPEGNPLRVKISLSLIGYVNKEESAQKENKQSPDLSRIIVLKSGESILSWCNEIYGDSSYCTDIARINNLSGFRNIQAGTTLLFPAIK